MSKEMIAIMAVLATLISGFIVAIAFLWDISRGLADVRAQTAANTVAITEMRRDITANTEAIAELRRAVAANTAAIAELRGALLAHIGGHTHAQVIAKADGAEADAQ